MQLHSLAKGVLNQDSKMTFSCKVRNFLRFIIREEEVSFAVEEEKQERLLSFFSQETFTIYSKLLFAMFGGPKAFFMAYPAFNV